jgi:hypothetical protein
MTALRLSPTLAATFFGSLGAALGLYAAAFIGVGNDKTPSCALFISRVNGQPGPPPQPVLLPFSRPSSA